MKKTNKDKDKKNNKNSSSNSSSSSSSNNNKKNNNNSNNKKKKENDIIELSEEELEEELQDEAARIIQTAFRSKLARNLLKSLIRQNYVKLKDRNTNIYYYKNKTTGETSILKPRILKEDDLPTPRDFQAPLNYNPGFYDEEGYALLIHVTKFSGEKIPNFHNQIDADHNIFEHLLSHDYICKFRPENVFSLKDPTIPVLKDSIERIRHVIKKRSYLFVYICTHVVTISSKVSKDNCFFCFKETVWNNSNQAALTSLSLTDFAKLIISLGCDRKVIVVNYAHLEPPRKSFFKSRYLYPPEDCLIRLADMCDCVVIGSCNIGTSIQDMKSHTPRPPQVSKRRGALRVASSTAGVSLNLDNGPQTIDQPVLSTTDIIRKKNSMQVHHSVHGDDIQHIASDATREVTADLIAQYQKEWILAEKKENITTTRPKPKLPGLKWKKIDPNEGNNETGGVTANPKELKTLKSSQSLPLSSSPKRLRRGESKEEKQVEKQVEKKEVIQNQTVEEKENLAAKQLGIQIALPTNKEMRKYQTSLITWSIQSKVLPIYNFFQSRYQKHQLENGTSPKQKSLLTTRYSLFGQAVCDGLNGNLIPSNHSKYISAMDLFVYIRKSMKRNIINCEDQLDADGNIVIPRQDPVIFVPYDSEKFYDQNPVCCQCGPPAQPDTPFIVKCKPNSALLEWIMPPFDGVPPTHYKIYMRNNCRLYYDWSVVPGAEMIPYKPDQHGILRYNVSHLPSGVRVEFCISAYNKGGWSQLSKPSVQVTPGEELEPQSIRLEWKKVIKGGPLAILDRLARYPQYRDEHIRGMHNLITFAQKESKNGFLRINIRTKVIQLTIHALNEFKDDNEICWLSFTLIGYSLHGKDKEYNELKKKLLNYHKESDSKSEISFLDHLNNCMIKYRNDSHVINSINWLRKVLPKEIPPLPEQKIIPFGTLRNDEDEDSDDNEEEVVVVNQDNLNKKTNNNNNNNNNNNMVINKSKSNVSIGNGKLR